MELLADVKAVMRPSLLILAIALASIFAIASDKTVQSDSRETAVRAQGKKIFVSRCAQCHDDNASKKLPDGTTLLKRLEKRKDLEARLQTRLKNPEESHAVALYMNDLLGRSPASVAAQSSSKTASH